MVAELSLAAVESFLALLLLVLLLFFSSSYHHGAIPNTSAICCFFRQLLHGLAYTSTPNSSRTGVGRAKLNVNPQKKALCCMNVEIQLPPNYKQPCPFSTCWNEKMTDPEDLGSKKNPLCKGPKPACLLFSKGLKKGKPEQYALAATARTQSDVMATRKPGDPSAAFTNLRIPQGSSGWSEGAWT